jgi:hypothetical protein
MATVHALKSDDLASNLDRSTKDWRDVRFGGTHSVDAAQMLVPVSRSDRHVERAETRPDEETSRPSTKDFICFLCKHMRCLIIPKVGILNL